MSAGFRGSLGAGVCALSLLAMGSGAARAESLTDAIALAYQTNPTLQAQRAQLRYTDETYVQARAGYRPQASASGGFDWRWQSLGTGNCSVFVTPCDTSPDSTNFNVGLSVSQPLYTGGRATARVRGAEADVLAAREDLRRIEGQVMLAVIQAYEDVRRDEQALAIRKDNVDVLKRQVDETRARFEVGEVTRTDVAQSEAQLAQAQALLSSAQAQLASSRAAYGTVVGQSPAKLDPEPPFKVFPDTIEQAFDTTEQNSPQVRSADYAAQSAGALVAEAKAQRLPQVSLTGSYGYSEPFNPWNSGLIARSATAGVSFTQPLFSGGVISSQIRQAIERENIARVGLEQARRTAMQTVSQAWNGLLAARANVAADQEEVRAARIAFEGTRAEQQVGLRTTLEVLSAQQVLENAELALVGARHDEYLASATVLNAMGLLEAKDLAPQVARLDGGHPFGELKRTFGYLPGVEEGVSAIDSIGAPRIDRRPPPVDAPITTGVTAEAPTPSAPGAP